MQVLIMGTLIMEKNFCNDENMCLLDVELLNASTYTCEHVEHGIKFWTDHVVISSNLTSSVCDCKVCIFLLHRIII